MSVLSDDYDELYYEMKAELDKVKAVLAEYARILIGMGPTRSVEHNRYYWGIIIPAAIQCFRYAWGQRLTKEYTHDSLRGLFLGIDIVNHKTGEVLRVGRSSRTLTTAEFNDYIQTIRAWLWDEAQISTEPLPEED